MPFQICLTILICLILGISGCMKAVAPKPAAPPTEPPPKVELKGPYDSEIPVGYLDLLRRVPVPAGEAVPLTFLAVADHFAARGEEDRALHFLDRAADGFVREKNRSGEAAAWSRKVVLLSDSGRETEARELIRKVGEAWKAPPLRAFPRYLEGHLALLQGDFPRAISALNRSLQDNTTFRGDTYLLKLRRDTELDAGIAAVLADSVPGLLTAYGLTGRPITGAGPAAAADHLREALALNQELYQTKIAPLFPAADFQKLEAEAHNFLGLETGMRGDGAEAFRHLVHAGELSRKAGFPAGEIRSLLFLGELGLQGESGTEGRQAAELLRERADRRGASPYRIWARFLLARYEEREGRKQEAIRFLEEAAGVIEAQRSPLMVDMLDEVCRRQRRSVYESLVEILAGEGMAAEALRAAEAAKATATVDLLTGQEIGRTDGERELLREETVLGGEIRGLQRRILQISDEAVAGGPLERLKHAEETYRELLGRIGVEEERLLSLIAVRGVDPAALQRLLDENTTLFDYFSTRDGLYVWAIHRGQVHLERIGLPREELRSFVLSFLAAIRNRNKRKTESFARRAYDLLLKPIIPFVSGERIGFIPDDALVYLPFAAMSYRGRFLAEGFTIFHLPEAALLGQVLGETRTAGLRILAFGNPDLENEALDLNFAVQEVERIRKRIGGTTVLLGQEASEAKAGEMPAGYDILHFAVRGQFFPEEILHSGLLLTPGAGQDGRLTVREIFRLRFTGRAVVLSGCDPIPEKDPEGKGLVSLQRAFLSAGSPSVVSTLWLSDDKAVAHLLDLFYRQLEKKEPLADALRAAQLHLLREGYPPYVWAAFVLTGKY
ncbi:MAG: CHAT domain-containing protein [Deltaproteobacteria bacterium]|nr:CHAT domain-containing protein [Deltaproteobacteria bacterium]